MKKHAAPKTAAPKSEPSEGQLAAKLSAARQESMKRCQSAVAAILAKYNVELVPVILVDGKGVVSGSISLRPLS